VAVPGDEARLRRSWPQRLLIAFNICCVLGALGTAGALGYANVKLGDVVRVGGLTGSLRSPEDLPAGAPQNYLLVGADDATGLGPDDPEIQGRENVVGVRTDTIMVLRIDPRDATARLLSFPRDLWVPIAGSRSKSRINEAIATGGAKGLIDTIKLNYGIPIDHYVQVNFASFKELVEAVDGVPMYFPEPVKAPSSRLLIPKAGCVTLDPTQALAFARARKDYAVLRDGEWELDSSGDLGRVSRQQYFIQTALRRAVAKGVRNPNTLRQLVGLGVRSVKIDQQLRIDDIVDLGARFRSFNPDNLLTYSLPVTEAVKGGAQVLELNAAEAEPVLALFRGAPAPGASATGALAPPSVRVQVLNGSRAEGQATEVTRALSAIGFSTGPPDDAEGFDGARTTVRFSPGKVAQARTVARYVTGPVVLEERVDVAGADVVLVTATDWQGTRTTPKPDAEVPGPPTAPPTPSPTTDPSAGSPSSPSTTPPSTTSTSVVGDVPGPPPPGQTCG